MKNLHLYAVSTIVSYWLFSGLDMFSIWTFILPIIITKAYLFADDQSAKTREIEQNYEI